MVISLNTLLPPPSIRKLLNFFPYPSVTLDPPVLKIALPTSHPKINLLLSLLVDLLPLGTAPLASAVWARSIFLGRLLFIKVLNTSGGGGRSLEGSSGGPCTRACTGSGAGREGDKLDNHV